MSNENKVKKTIRIKAIDEFKSFLKKENYTWIDFGNGLLFVFSESGINVRQYHDEECLSSWIDEGEFFSAINQLPTQRALKDIEKQSVINKEDDNE